MPAHSIVEQIRENSPALSVGVFTGDRMNLRSELTVLENAGVGLLHIDVMDGRIWPKITVGTSFVQGLKTSLLKDVHLLIDKPEDKIESFVKAGADIITFSAEYCKDIAATLGKIGRMQNANDPGRGIVKGLSLNPSTPIDKIVPFIEYLDVVVLLAIGPDTGSDNFISALPDRIKQVRTLKQNILIFVDGAINKKNVADVAKMCPDVIVTGSAVFDGKDAAGNLKFMLDAIKVPDSNFFDSATTVDLKYSMELAGRHLTYMISPTHDYTPYWTMDITEDYKTNFFYSWSQHNVGRLWDALLRLDGAIGFRMPVEIEQHFLKTTKVFFDNPDHLTWPPIGSIPQKENVMPFGGFELHSMREMLLALNALIRFRHDAWAIQTGHSMLQTIESAYRDDGTWDFDKFWYYKHIDPNRTQSAADPTYTHGRMIEAIVLFYQTTSDPLALELASKFAEYHFAHTTMADGSFDKKSAWHTHSYFCTLRGLLLYGELTNQHKFVDRVAITYKNTVRKFVKKSGWTSHDIGRDNGNGGEVTSPGDAAQIALWLATRHGYQEFFDDVERIVRCRLIPSQIIQRLPLTPARQGDDTNYAEMVIGAYASGLGLASPSTYPHGRQKPITDISAAVLHSLIDVYQSIAVTDQNVIRVNMHFDYEDKNIAIRSVRTKQARVTINRKVQKDLFVRIPGWVLENELQVLIGGDKAKCLQIDDFIYIPANLIGEIVLEYNLPIRTEVERTAGVGYYITYRGDEILGIYPNTDFLPLYKTYKPIQ